MLERRGIDACDRLFERIDRLQVQPMTVTVAELVMQQGDDLADGLAHVERGPAPGPRPSRCC